MERRRINLEDEQLSLPLAHPPLERRRLAEDSVATVTLRVTNEIAKAFNANPDGALAFIGREADRYVNHPIGVTKYGDIYDVTDWSRGRPPCSGYWELKQRSALAPDVHNWWYSAKLNAWHRGVPQQNSRDARFVSHGVLMQGYEWRGLGKPWPEGYEYELEQAEFASGIAINVDDIAPYSLHDAQGLARSELTPPVVEDRNPARRRVLL